MNVTSLKADKRRVRRLVHARMEALPDAERARAGEEVVSLLAPLLDEIPPGSDVALFASLSKELPTTTLLDAVSARGLSRVLPRVEGDDLVFHRMPVDATLSSLRASGFGVPEPLASWPVVALSSCDLVVMPGLAFDRSGRRLGYGRGFYDRAISRMRQERPVPAVAACMDCQLVDEVPAGPEDEIVDGLAAPALGLLWLQRPAPP